MWLSLPIFCSQTKNAWWHRQQNKGADGNKYKNRISKVLKQIHPEVHHFETDYSRMFSGFCLSVIRYVLFWDFMQRRMVACYQHFLDQEGVLKRQQQTKLYAVKIPDECWSQLLLAQQAQYWYQSDRSHFIFKMLKSENKPQPLPHHCQFSIHKSFYLQRCILTTTAYTVHIHYDVWQSTAVEEMTLRMKHLQWSRHQECALYVLAKYRFLTYLYKVPKSFT